MKTLKSTEGVARGSLRGLVSLSSEDIRTLKEATGRRGYALPRFDAKTGKMNTRQWQSWQKLANAGLAIIEGMGEAEDLVITDNGRAALRQANND